MSKNTKKIIQYLITTIIVVVSLWLVFKDLDFSMFVDIMRTTDYKWALYAIPITLLSHLVRAYRWKVILTPIKKVTSILNLFSAVMVGYFVNTFLPRGGEIVRPIAYSRREKLSLSTVFGTIIFERVLDLIFLVLLFWIAFVFFSDRIVNSIDGLSTSSVVWFMSILLAVFLTMVVAVFTNMGSFLLKIFLKPLSITLYEKADALLKKFINGMAIIRAPELYIKTIFQSVLIWFIYMLPMYLMFNSFEFLQPLNLDMGDAFLLLIVAGIGVTLAPSPGGIGVYHWIVQQFFVAFYGLTEEQGLAFATLAHAQNILTQVVFGLIFFLRENVQKLPSEKELSKTIEHDDVNLSKQAD